MLVLTSPAKTINSELGKDFPQHSIPTFTAEALQLVNKLKKFSIVKLCDLMSISRPLAMENKQRYIDFSEEFNTENANPAIFAFQGDVYRGLDIQSFSEEEVLLANDKIRIISGLYGVLKPLDLMQPYRLEMGTRLPIRRKRNLYEFWGAKVTQELNKAIIEHNHTQVLNLASNEYYKAVKPSDLNAPVISANFKEYRDGELKFISFTAKIARGLMMRYIIKNDINDIESVKRFDYDGYSYNPEFSSKNEMIFSREG